MPLSLGRDAGRYLAIQPSARRTTCEDVGGKCKQAADISRRLEYVAFADNNCCSWPEQELVNDNILIRGRISACD